MENLKAVLTVAIEAATKLALPVLAGFAAGVPVGAALVWWFFL